MAYVSKQLKAEVSESIKPLCKKFGVKATLSVRNNMCLVLKVKNGKLNFFEFLEDENNMSIGQYGTNRKLSAECSEFVDKAIKALKGKDYYDNTDIMTDYFDTSHYIEIQIIK